MGTETQEQNIDIEYLGEKLGKMKIVYNPRQKEITVTIEVEPGPNLEIRTFSSGPDHAQFTIKEIGLS